MAEKAKLSLFFAKTTIFVCFLLQAEKIQFCLESALGFAEVAARPWGTGRLNHDQVAQPAL